MASGDLLCSFGPADGMPPASNYATLDTRNGRLCLDFDASTDESIVFHGELPNNYAGGGITIEIVWRASTATSGDCYWQAAFEKGTTDIDSDSFAEAQSGNGTANGTSGIATQTTIAFTDGAQIDNVGAGDEFWLKINRDADNGSDDMTGDAELYLVNVRET